MLLESCVPSRQSRPSRCGLARNGRSRGGAGVSAEVLACVTSLSLPLRHGVYYLQQPGSSRHERAHTRRNNRIGNRLYPFSLTRLSPSIRLQVYRVRCFGQRRARKPGAGRLEVVAWRWIVHQPTHERSSLRASFRASAYQMRGEVRPRAIETLTPEVGEEIAGGEQRDAPATGLAAFNLDRAALTAHVVKIARGLNHGSKRKR